MPYTNKQLRLFAYKTSKGQKVPADWKKYAKGRHLNTGRKRTSKRKR